MGVTVNVGAPIAVDNAIDPTIIQFPFSFTQAAGAPTANGSYTFSIQSPTNNPVVSEDGKDLVPSGPITFTLADTTSPTIIGTTFTGRTVAITFSKALDPATVTLQNFFVLRQGPVAAWPPTAATLSDYINLNSDPRTTISYNPTTFTVTLNYSALPQTELPSDKYAIVVLSPMGTSSGVTDLVGNPLFGTYIGTLPDWRRRDDAARLHPEPRPADTGRPDHHDFRDDPHAHQRYGNRRRSKHQHHQPNLRRAGLRPISRNRCRICRSIVDFADAENGGVPTLAVGGGGRGFSAGPVSLWRR